jgi:hypothetical protein
MGAALGLAARARTPRAVMPGVRATATRHASGGCGAGLGFGGVGGRGAGEKGARAGGRLRRLSWSGAARGLADDARVRGHGGRKEEKRGGRLEAPIAEWGDAAEASRREPGGAGERKGKADGWDPPISCPGRKEGKGVR